MRLQPFRNALSAGFVVLLAACGGSVGPSPVVVDPLVITVQPSTATIYPGVATTLVITGGTGSYVVTSDNQAAVPLASLAVGHTLTVIANPVIADTVVTLSVRDTGTTPQKTATLTVKPGTVQNQITVTPATAACSPAVCTGDEALISTTVAQAGIPLAARGVRFDVISGDVRFITTPPGTTPEQLSLTTSTASDQAGVARVRLRALANVPSQTALIQITDIETGAFQRLAINVQQFTGTGNASFFALPESITFTGPFIGQCASNPSTDVVVFGGSPPYNIVATGGGLFVNPSVVTTSGGRFNVSGQGSGCFTNIPVAITDSAGRTIAVTLTNKEGTAAAPVPAVTVAPTSLTLACGQSGSLAISGGATPFSVNSSNPAVTVAVSGRTVTVTRQLDTTPATNPASATVTVSDGTSSASAVVSVPTSCPALTITPDPFTLNCGATQTLTIAGGTPPFAVSDNHSQVTTSVAGRTVTVTRPATDVPAGMYPTSVVVTASDALGAIGTSTGSTFLSCP